MIEKLQANYGFHRMPFGRDLAPGMLLIGVRGIHEEIGGAFGQAPSHLSSRLITQTGKALLAEREERSRTPSSSSTRRTC